MNNDDMKKLYCSSCDYRTKNRNDFNKHLTTKKHFKNRRISIWFETKSI